MIPNATNSIIKTINSICVNITENAPDETIQYAAHTLSNLLDCKTIREIVDFDTNRYFSSKNNSLTLEELYGCLYYIYKYFGSKASYFMKKLEECNTN